MLIKNCHIRLRPAVAGDTSALVRLEKRVFDKDRFDRDLINSLITIDRAFVLVCEHEGEIIGAAYTLWKQKPDFGRLFSLAVDKNFQGNGLGSLLLSECEMETARHGYGLVRLEVRENNHQARFFYEKHGYLVVDRIRKFYEDGATAIVMTKKIDRSSIPPAISDKGGSS